MKFKLTTALAAAVFLAAAGPVRHVLREQAWTASGAALAHDLTRAPGECLASSGPEIEVGRVLFRSPVLLGGPAARIGLSCNACHPNGRVNAGFFLPELTDRPGAADVTSEWTSHVRGDGIMNPVDIPDLVGVGSRATHGRLRDPSLEHFVASVIGEEFQGPPPPPQALEGVLAYLRALDSASCPANEAQITLASAADDVRRALAAAQSAEPLTASLLLASAQDAMGRIVERLPPQRFASDRARLEALARELGALRGGDDIGAGLDAALPAWRARFDAAIARIAPRERRTYFNETALRRAFQP